MCLLATCALGLGCKRDLGPALQVIGESEHVRSDEPFPTASPWFDGTRLTLVAAQNEVLGIQVLHRDGAAVTLAIDGARVAGYTVDAFRVSRPSTAMYGGSHGAGSYPDGLTASAAPTSNPAYFAITAIGAPGAHAGELIVGTRHVSVALTIVAVAMPRLPITAWAYYDPRELGGTLEAPNAAERECIAMFRDRGVLLSPDLPVGAFTARRELLGDTHFVPAVIDDPRADVAAWLAATEGTGLVPFAIPIDEPNAAHRANVRALADAARQAGSGPGKFLFAVTDEPRAEYGDAIDLYITLRAHAADAFERWTYNGAPPRAGSMVLDAESPGVRTWGWIAAKYRIAIWYIWDALYWHDRHNRKRALTPADDATSFDDGEDHGNLDGVLATPGCHATLRLEALRRGFEDRALIELARRCNSDAVAQLVDHMMPRALGDASGTPAWPRDEAAWEAARRRLLEIAATCAK